MDRVYYLEKIAGESIEPLMQALNKLTFPEKKEGRFKGRKALCFLKVFNGTLRCSALSSAGRKHPLINEMLIKLRNQITELPLEHCIVNRNTTCDKHTDDNNIGPSVIVSFGDYQGGKLIIRGKEHDPYLQPIEFDGAKMEHYNTLHTGLKYSVIFFTPKGSVNKMLTDEEYIERLQDNARRAHEAKKRKLA